jgi:hypothetical protein
MTFVYIGQIERFRILPCQSLTGVSSSLLPLRKKSLSVKRVVAAGAFTTTP